MFRWSSEVFRVIVSQSVKSDAIPTSILCLVQRQIGSFDELGWVAYGRKGRENGGAYADGYDPIFAVFV